MNDYERVARLIQFLDEHHTAQPSLGDLAKRLELSRFHLHRLFSTWAGVTPKDFLQCLTFSHARTLLRNGENVMQSALSAGLSGPSRLHDLCMSIEAASPGELKSGGAGCELSYGFARTPFGEWLAAQTPRGICHIAFLEPGERASALRNLEQEWPAAQLRRDDSAAARLSERVFEFPRGNGATGGLRAYVRGTPFQLKVWRALIQVPVGGLVSYGWLARAVGQAEAARAAGTAVGKNPVAFLIPCHRVIRETGLIGGYRWGQVRKRAMIAWESSRAAQGNTALLTDLTTKA